MTQHPILDKWAPRAAIAIHCTLAVQFFAAAWKQYESTGAADVFRVAGGVGFLLLASNVHALGVAVRQSASMLEHIQHLNNTLEETFRAASRKKEESQRGNEN